MIAPPGWAPLQSKPSVLSLIVLSDWCYISCITSTMDQPDYSVWVNLKTSLYFLVFCLNSKLYLISDNLQNLYLGSKTWDREQRTSLPINTDYASRAQGDFYRVLTTRTTLVKFKLISRDFLLINMHSSRLDLLSTAIMKAMDSKKDHF